MNMKRSWPVVIFLAAISVALIQIWQPSVNKWEAAIKRFEESDRQNPPAKDAVLFIGSSSIASWQSLAEDFPGTKVINRGFGGSQIADSIFYVDRIVIPYQPKIVVLYAGDNDLASGKTPQQVFDDYSVFVERVHRSLPKTRIAFVSIKPSPARASILQAMKDSNERIKAYASGDERLMYIDIFSSMIDGEGSPRSELFGPDNLHMNEKGYSLWKMIIAPYIR